jgi:histidinol-phosphate/aromatic aminotransferase/cobyric acid decarboxylase-like protein
MLHTINSQADFVMLEAGPTAIEIVRHFEQHNITVPQPFPSFDEYIRVSLGTAGDMHEFWRVWDLLPRRAMSHM